MLEIAQAVEEQSTKDYNNWAMEWASHTDSMSKKLFAELVMDEERHYGQYDDELENVAKYGNEYLALQSIERSKTIAAMNTNNK